MGKVVLMRRPKLPNFLSAYTRSMLRAVFDPRSRSWPHSAIADGERWKCDLSFITPVPPPDLLPQLAPYCPLICIVASGLPERSK